MAPFFSIVVPVYNAEKYLVQCFQSTMEQSFSNFEVIIIDDGSSDGSGQLCDEQCKSDKRFYVRHQNNKGASEARSEGIRAAKGKYIICIDSDDLLDRELLQTLYEVCAKYDPDIICYDYQEVDEYGQLGKRCISSLDEGLYTQNNLIKLKKRLLYDIDQNKHNMGAVPFSTWSKAIRKETIELYSALAPCGIRNGDDLVVTIPAISNSKSVYILHTVGYYYRILQSSMVHSFRENELEGISKVISHVQEYTDGIPYNNLCGYAYCMVLGQTVLASRHLANYKQFKIFTQQHIGKDLGVYIASFKHKRLNWYSKLRMFLFKHNLWLYWCMSKYIH